MDRTFPSAPTTETPEYTRKGRARRRETEGESSRGKRLRLVYFGVAALWGFVVGTASVALALQVVGAPVSLYPAVTVVLLPGAGLAMAGGTVAASAYREARRRRSS